MKEPIFIISGVPGCGKSTIARELVKHFEFGMIIPIEKIREFVVSGYSGPFPEWTDETTRQFNLAFTATAGITSLYNNNGFAVIIEQVLSPKDVAEKILPLIDNKYVIRVFLNPDLNTILERNRNRVSKNFDTSCLAEPIKAMHPYMIQEFTNQPDWNSIDSTRQTIEETTAEILGLMK